MKNSNFEKSISIFAVIIAVLILKAVTIRVTMAEPGNEKIFPEVENKVPLSEEELEKKRKGSYVIGLPMFTSDPDKGLGFGGVLFYYYNGNKNNPLFRYTPYFHRLALLIFATTNGFQRYTLGWDAPYFKGSLYRIRSNISFYRNISANYFGVGNDTLSPLKGPPTIGGNSFSNFEEYNEKNRELQSDGVTYSRYHNYIFEKPMIFLSLERDFLGGMTRALGGFYISKVNIEDYTGKEVNAAHDQEGIMGETKLSNDQDAGLIAGFNGGWDNSIKIGITLDTRDFEPDPNKGIFSDFTIDISNNAFGSNFNYYRYTLTPRFYYSPIPKLADLVLALRGIYSIQTGDIPFFSMNTLSFTDGYRYGLGGVHTMRGYKQDRFMGKVLTLMNLEVRWTFSEFNLFNQNFAFILVPFIDSGRVFDNPKETNLTNWKMAYGLGFRFVWNQSPLMRVDYGISAEDSGVYLNFAHIF